MSQLSILDLLTLPTYDVRLAGSDGNQYGCKPLLFHSYLKSPRHVNFTIIMDRLFAGKERILGCSTNMFV